MVGNSLTISVLVEKNIKVQEKNLSLCAKDCQFLDGDPFQDLDVNEAGCSQFMRKLVRVDAKGFKRCNDCLMAVLNLVK